MKSHDVRECSQPALLPTATCLFGGRFLNHNPWKNRLGFADFVVVGEETPLEVVELEAEQVVATELRGEFRGGFGEDG